MQGKNFEIYIFDIKQFQECYSRLLSDDDAELPYRGGGAPAPAPNNEGRRGR